ncbi:hypothetical protein EPIB1_70 [Tritonibacter mobilis]|jgi:hypothetical protein|uniref:DUF2218 domain-containing protein n=1 Tax=Tritonibacter TaxID=2083206 RepID=UPI0009BEF938|nr:MULTISPECIES: DUF2218 domain-containing protein [Tritonibacter]MCZ4267601.1 DUF2218 domain-containing protein [Rhodobacteraceae bacterium G21628-S1]MCA2006090.1 DUF2218 domain-containing protein [Tritonibacter mobilis]NHM18155.1 DUF2218 domain-containing protein [Tritonibacter mobilis]NHM22551.1 DUF2218 domain-containing protein [Tritonibacter mobilis]VCU57172.1 hypothetical protein EPIB1_70 [Tritonibacter mobilis]
MLTSESQFETAKASQYLQQLCKHFAHKVEASCDAHSGKVAFPCGTATFAASDDVLVMTVVAEDQAGLEQSKEIIESHLIRFAFRDKLERLDWS